MDEVTRPGDVLALPETQDGSWAVVEGSLVHEVHETRTGAVLALMGAGYLLWDEETVPSTRTLTGAEAQEYARPGDPALSYVVISTTVKRYYGTPIG